MPTYSETLRYLYRLQYRGMKFGLRNMRALTAFLGHPERRFPSLHVAGTNGKGSTSAFLAAACRSAGMRTGLYTSPHLLRFTERIRVDGAELSEKRLVYYVQTLRPAIEEVGATFFEATTAVAFQFFADENVDIAVVETGLGGRLDATNVLLPLASVITSIGLDHTAYLGTTLTSIAHEKGGIIKPGVPVILGPLDRAPRNVLQSIAKQRHAPCFLAERVIRGEIRREEGLWVVRPEGRRGIHAALQSGLPGMHQASNLRTAAAVLEVLDRRGALPLHVSRKDIKKGARNVKRLAGLRGRMDAVSTPEGKVLLDVGHNPDGLSVMMEALRADRERVGAVVFGAMADKDTKGMLGLLRGLGVPLVAVRPKMARALTTAGLASQARELGWKVATAGSVEKGLKIGRQLAGKRLLLVTGSHYVVSEALLALERRAATKT